MNETRLRIVQNDDAPGSALRRSAVASFLAARMASAKDGGGAATLHLNPLSFAGMLLVILDDPAWALNYADGSDDFAVRTRIYLREIMEQEGPSDAMDED